VVQQWRDSSLYVLPAGQIPPNPSEILGSEPMETLFDHLTKEFDYVLVCVRADQVGAALPAAAALELSDDAAMGRDVARWRARATARASSGSSRARGISREVRS
jgi:hypothetical protein